MVMSSFFFEGFEAKSAILSRRRVRACEHRDDFVSFVFTASASNAFGAM
jgi:hypothetical protein